MGKQSKNAKKTIFELFLYLLMTVSMDVQFEEYIQVFRCTAMRNFTCEMNSIGRRPLNHWEKSCGFTPVFKS